MYNGRPVPVTDFSGGFTDNYLDGDPRKCYSNDNFVVTSDKHLKSRDGSTIYNSTYYQIPDGAVRIGTLIPHDNSDLFYHYGRKLYYINAGWVNLTGPGGNQAFDTATTDNYVTFSEWKKQLFVTNDAATTSVNSYVHKIYKDETSTFRLRTAGLPAVPDTANYVDLSAVSDLCSLANDIRVQMLDHFESSLTRAINCANHLKTKFNLHIADTLLHKVADTTHITTSADATNLATLIVLVKEMVTDWNGHWVDADAAFWTYHYDVDPISTRIDYDNYNLREPFDLYSCVKVLLALRTQYNLHDTSATPHKPAATMSTHQATVSVSPASSHSASDTTAYNLITAGNATTEAELYTLTGQLLVAYDQHFRDAVKASPLLHGADPTDQTIPTMIDNTSRSSLVSLEVPTTFPEAAARLDDLKLKFNIHLGDIDKHFGSSEQYDLIVTESYSYGINKGPAFFRDLSSLYRLANTIKKYFNFHVARVGAAAVHNNVAAGTAISAADAIDDPTFALLVTDIIRRYSNHIDATTEGNNLHDGTAADRSEDQISDSISNTLDLFYGSPEGDIERQAEILNEILEKYNHHQQDLVPHQNSSAYQNLDRAQANAFEFGNYLYAFHYEYTYFVGSVEYVDQGPTLLKEFSLVPLIDNESLDIVGIPVFTNASMQNYPVSSMKVKIARTTNGGKEFYYVGEVTNGTTTYTDRTTDARLVTGVQLYTAGGVVDNDPPPMCKTLHIVDNQAYYGNCIVDGEAFPNRVYQSLYNDPDSVPADFFDDMEDEVSIVTSAASRRVVICKTKTYRLEGSFDELGRGSLSHEKIGDVGSECPASAVQTKEGVFFAGNHGFYYTDGYQVQPISVDWPTTYLGIISTAAKQKRIQGTYDSREQKIYWTIQAESGNSENDTILVLDLRYGIREDSTFSTWSNSSYFKPSAILFFGGNLLRADSRGYTFKHAAGVTSDPRINTSVIPSLWGKVPIVYDYISCASSGGNPKLLKFTPSMEVWAKNWGNLSLQPKSINNDSGSAASLNPIRYRQGYTGMIREERTFPAGGLRWSYKQIGFTNATVIVTNSDTLGQATVNSVAKTLTLDSAVTQDWPADALDWYIYFANDSYTQGFQVTVRSADTLTFSDAGNLCPATGSYKWVLKGIPKDEIFELVGYNLNLQIGVGDNLKANQANSSGANA